MPKYRITLSDGRTFSVEANQKPSEADIMAHLSKADAPQQPPKSVHDMSLDEMIAKGGPLEGYANLVNSARYGAVGSPLIPGSAAGLFNAAKAGASRVASVAGKAMPFVAKAGLRMAGVPARVADAVVDTATAFRNTRPSSAAPAARSASSPAAPAPTAAPASPAVPSTPSAAPGSSPRPNLIPHPEGGVWSQQRIASEVGLAARRQKVTLTKEQYAQAEAMVNGGKGASPAEAVKAVAGSAPKAPAAASAKPKMNVDEAKVYVRLRGQGKTHQQAVEAVEAQRALVQRLGTPSTDEVVRKVVDRNVTGRWQK